jgi:FtsZ-binding cell division protein ZapB
MDRFETLTKKISTLIDRATVLKKENDQLKSQIKFMEEENTRSKRVLYENESLNKTRVVLREKVNHILSKLSELKI